MATVNRKKRRSKRRVKIYKSKPEQRARLSNDEVRSINKKKVNRRRKHRKNLMALLFGALVLCIGIILVFSLFFKINTVTVSGDAIYSDKMIIEGSGIELGSNLFRVKESDVSTALAKKLPYIKSAEIERKLPDTIVIKTKATKEVAAISSSGAFILIDETGKVLDKDASVLREGVPLVSGVKIKKASEGGAISLTDSKKTTTLKKLLSEIAKSELNLLTEINLKNNGDIKIKYDERITLEIGSLTNIEKKLARASAAIEKENEINAYSTGTLDLKTDPYAFFKAGKAETTKKNTKSDKTNKTDKSDSKKETVENKTTEKVSTTVNIEDLPAAV